MVDVNNAKRVFKEYVSNYNLLKDRLEGMFPTVRRVFECLEK